MVATSMYIHQVSVVKLWAVTMETALDGSREIKESKTPYVIKAVLGGRKVISFGPGDHENPFNWPFVCSTLRCLL